ncbi:hypothetical protein PORCRE_408 [Porphyromonas crevioricanis JCM 15906]|uniref:Uncharacterized protein n=1 Tax=Porphyromonas crevioricanis JCM 15906 TaxID=1305617 RepID=S4N6T5_9PORP|nr:hypothetical protein PORCRE_408 [Porphyromonas crevioricanis JCM 15906]
MIHTILIDLLIISSKRLYYGKKNFGQRMSCAEVNADFRWKVDSAHHFPNQSKDNPLRRAQTSDSRHK